MDAKSQNKLFSILVLVLEIGGLMNIILDGNLIVGWFLILAGLLLNMLQQYIKQNPK